MHIIHAVKLMSDEYKISHLSKAGFEMTRDGKHSTWREAVIGHAMKVVSDEYKISHPTNRDWNDILQQ
jgi:hypothetical protein